MERRIQFTSYAPLNGAQDRISELPDCVLHQILSLLPMKSAIRTSILSKRWKNKWKCVWSYAKALDFGEEFKNGQTPEEFVGHVSRILNLHNGKKIDSFQLYFYPGDQYLSDVEIWVKFATSRGVKELHLDFGERIHVYDGYLVGEVQDPEERKRVKLPSCLLDCALLAHLTLNFIDLSPFLNFNDLGSLKTLSLKQVNITDDMLVRLFSDCPLLEDLSLIDCSYLYTIKVDTARLKRLTVVTCYCGYYLEISAPNLQSFCFQGEIFDHSFKNISALDDALISSEQLNGYDFDHDRAKILSDLAHVKILTTDSWAILHLAEAAESEDLPITFPNLHELQLLVHRKAEISHACYFFRNIACPCLEKIFLQFPTDPYNRCSEEVSETPVTNPADYTFYHLKTVQINNFGGCQNDMALVKFFLAKAIVLECLVLIAPQSGIADTEEGCASQPESIEMPLELLWKQLLLLPKASQTVQIFLFDYSENSKSLRPTHTEFYCEV